MPRIRTTQRLVAQVPRDDRLVGNTFFWVLAVLAVVGALSLFSCTLQVGQWSGRRSGAQTLPTQTWTPVQAPQPQQPAPAPVEQKVSPEQAAQEFWRSQ